MFEIRSITFALELFADNIIRPQKLFFTEFKGMFIFSYKIVLLYQDLNDFNCILEGYFYHTQWLLLFNKFVAGKYAISKKFL